MGNPNGHLVHGYAKHPLYAVWTMIKQRCENPQNKGYKWYGAKGIDVCEEWSKSVVPFIEWAEANGYEPGLSIDRIDVHKGYYPENCRWITLQEQNSNRTTTHFITFKGETHTLTEWSVILKIARPTLSNRIIHLGWSIEDAFTRKIRRRHEPLSV